MKVSCGSKIYLHDAMLYTQTRWPRPPISSLRSLFLLVLFLVFFVFSFAFFLHLDFICIFFDLVFHQLPSILSLSPLISKHSIYIYPSFLARQDAEGGPDYPGIHHLGWSARADDSPPRGFGSSGLSGGIYA
jgi:hypothetical protein